MKICFGLDIFAVLVQILVWIHSLFLHLAPTFAIYALHPWHQCFVSIDDLQQHGIQHKQHSNPAHITTLAHILNPFFVFVIPWNPHFSHFSLYGFPSVIFSTSLSSFSLSSPYALSGSALTCSTISIDSGSTLWSFLTSSTIVWLKIIFVRIIVLIN